MSISFVPFQQCIRILACTRTGQEMSWQRLRQTYGGVSILPGEWFGWEAFHQNFPLPWATCHFILSYRRGAFHRCFSILCWLQVTERRKMIKTLTGRKEDLFCSSQQKRDSPQAKVLWTHRVILPASPALLHLTSRGLGAWRWTGPLLCQGDAGSSKRSSLYLGNQEQRALSAWL